MPVKPVLMVLYTNDSVEVRYSDGTRLHLMPCGTSFTFHSNQDDAHPANGMKTVEQRCCYVTSMYRDKLLAALDFRNRFAERPYLPSELLEDDQSVSLYARIKKIGWPKVATQQNCEVQTDGSVRITSNDEFGSLVLSAHRKDFTICYLSLLSQDKPRERTKPRKNDQSHKISSAKDNVHNKENQTKYNPNSSEESDQSQNSQNSNLSDEIQKLNREYQQKNDNHNLNNRGVPVHRKDGGDVDDLNISPITQASCNGSPQALSNTSGSPITPQCAIADKDAKFRPFSTPTQELEDPIPECTPYGKTAVFRDYNNQKSRQDQGRDYLKQQTHKKSESTRPKSRDNDDRSKHQENTDTTLHDNHRARNHHSQSTKQTKNSCSSAMLSCSDSFEPSHRSNNVSGTSYTSEGSESETRCQYCWVTRHYSCDECPVSWSHTIKLAQQVAEHGYQSLDKGQDKDPQKGKHSARYSKPQLREINKDLCVFATLPTPLPLTCTGQYLHKSHRHKAYNDEKNPLEDPSTFSLGRLKILLIDGVIYRIVRLSSTKCVEIYPGDGSVLISQGMSAHFFQHVLPNNGKIEERTYSIKSPPATSCGPYSVAGLIKRAHRFLSYVRQEDNLVSGPLCCWKYEETTLAAPLSTSILEECSVPGYGKFTALSNGQVRIVFHDRTSLDMTCDFTSRINNCLEHSDTGAVQGGIMLANKKIGMCRLLLPNGQYQMVDVNQPGIYKRYIEIGKEWRDWVNSSPLQRGHFYKNRQDNNVNMSVERELKKIQCFNYLVDHAVYKQTPQDSSLSDPNHSGAFKPYSASSTRPAASILRNSDQNKNRNSEPFLHQGSARTVQIQLPHASIDLSHTSTATGISSRSLIGQHQNVSNLIGQQSSSSNLIGQQSTSSNLIGQQSASSNLIGHQSTHSNLIGHQSNVLKLPSSARQHPIGRSVLQSHSHPIKSGLTNLEGFNAVREALLRTSNVINDIDHLLEKK